MKCKIIFFIAIVAIAVFGCNRVAYCVDKSTLPQVAFAKGEIEKALYDISCSLKTIVDFKIDTLLGSQAYSIQRNTNGIAITGGDEVGLM